MNGSKKVHEDWRRKKLNEFFFKSQGNKVLMPHLDFNELRLKKKKKNIVAN